MREVEAMNDSERLETRQEAEEVAEMIPVFDLPGAVEITLDTGINL